MRVRRAMPDLGAGYTACLIACCLTLQSCGETESGDDSAAERSKWAARVRALDPALADDAFLRTFVERHAELVPNVEGEAFDRLLRGLGSVTTAGEQERFDKELNDWTPEALESLVTFLESDTGQAVRRAQATFVRFTSVGDAEQWRLAVETLRDPAQVGAAARAEMARARDVLEGGTGSVSPFTLLRVLGATNLDEAQARSLDRFLQTETGQRWAEMRAELGGLTIDRLFRLRRRAVEAEILTDHRDLGDLILPQAEEKGPSRGR